MKKRKKKIIKIVAGIVVAAIIAGVVIGSQNQGTAAIPVYTEEPSVQSWIPVAL